MPPRDREHKSAQTQPIVTDEHRAAAAMERERSQSRTKFFTPVAEPGPDPDPGPSPGPGPRPDSDSAPHRTRLWRRSEPESIPGARPVSQDATYGPALPQESTVQLVLDLALRIGEVQMASGAGASDTTASIHAVAGAYGLPHCEVDVIFSSITVSVHRGSDVNPITALRLVRTRGQNYTRLEATERLLRKIAAGKIRVYEASAELDQITRAVHPYPRWAATLAWAGTAASIAVLIGGDGLLASLSAIIAAVIDRCGRVLNRRALPLFFQQLVGGLLATVLALGLVDSHLFAGLGNPQLVIGAAITVLLSGLSVVSTVQDAITGYYVTAAGRAVEITLTSAGLIAGVVVGLKLADLVGLANIAPPAPVPSSVLKLPITIAAGAAAAGFFALASYANPRSLLVAATAGALGAGSYGALQYAGAGPITSPAVAAVVIGFAGGVLARRLRIPPVIVAVAGLTPLLPGLSTYRALYLLAVGPSGQPDVTDGLTTLVVAVTIALGLGAGVVLGEFLAQPVRHGLGRLERRFAGPRFAGPLRPLRRKID